MLHPGRRKVVYPDSDGEPVADKDVSFKQMVDTNFALSRWFVKDPMVYVASNLLMYYVEGNPKRRVAPDVFLARVPKKLRDVYKVWEEGRPPEVTFEFMSRSSKHLDPEFKVPVYESLGVPEVYLYDPEGTWLTPRFQPFRLSDGRYQRVDTSVPVFSPALGLELRVEEGWLRLYDPTTGQRLPTPDEMADQAERDRDRADQATARAERETARVRELEAQIERLKRDRES